MSTGSTDSNALSSFTRGVEERVADSMGTRHVAQLLPEEYPREPDPPDVWKDEEAMGEWVNQLPEHDEVIILRIVNTPPEDQQLKNETRPPSS